MDDVFGASDDEVGLYYNRSLVGVAYNGCGFHICGFFLHRKLMFSMLKRKRQIKEEKEKEEEEEEDASPVAKKRKTSGKGFC